MQANQTPRRLPVPFAANGLKNDIPEDSQGTTPPGAATLNDGFPRATMLPPSSGGVPPSGKDFNGILNLLAQTVRWVQAGGSFLYDSDFAKDPNVGGYPKNAVLLRADGQGFWMSTADNNTTDPDATDGSARNWVPLNADWNATAGPGAILNKPTLARVATSGSYNDLSDKPAVPPAQVNSDWNASSGVARILNRPNLAAVATSGNYYDLSNRPDLSGYWSPGNLQPMTLGGMGNFVFVKDMVGIGGYIANPQVRWNGPVLPGTWLGCGNFSSGGDTLSLVVRVA